MRHPFLASQLIQGSSEAVGHLTSELDLAQFFLLITTSPARWAVADAGEG